MQVRSIPSYQSVRDTNEDGLSALTARPVEGIHPLHTRQPLEAQLHRFTVPPSSKAPRVVPAGGGHEYLAALRAAGDPGRQDDCPAEKVVFGLEDVGLSSRFGGDSSVREWDLDAGAAEVDHRDQRVGGVESVGAV